MTRLFTLTQGITHYFAHSPEKYEFCISTDQKAQLSLQDQPPGRKRKTEEMAPILNCFLFVFVFLRKLLLSRSVSVVNAVQWGNRRDFEAIFKGSRVFHRTLFIHPCALRRLATADWSVQPHCRCPRSAVPLSPRPLPQLPHCTEPHST